jgi:radical SAM protein with 4Fe4S-binding SPASM domain
MDGGKIDEGELDTNTMKKVLDILSQMGIFHIAMGGGEAIEREDLFEIAAYARNVGLVPNLTISGIGLTKEIAGKLKVFGQVNISMDGMDGDFGIFRGRNYFADADKAFDLLLDAGVPTGINCVIGKDNFKGIEDVFKYAAHKKLEEIEFLRFKPSGRGKSTYLQNKTTQEQNIALSPLLAQLSQKYKVTAKIDCSFVPMLCYHKPSIELLHSIGTYGCEAGNVLLGIRSNGKVSGCSFLENSNFSVFNLQKEYHDNPDLFKEYRAWDNNAVEPCKSCNYLGICKGGCHAVSHFIYNDDQRPDPDCPVVVEYLSSSKEKRMNEHSMNSNTKVL